MGGLLGLPLSGYCDSLLQSNRVPHKPRPRVTGALLPSVAAPEVLMGGTEADGFCIGLMHSQARDEEAGRVEAESVL